MTEPFQSENTPALPTDAPDVPTTRAKSSVKFPYNPLEYALDVVQAVSKSGVAASPGQLAAGLNTHVNSGAYRHRLSTAQTFNVVESERRGDITLSPIGRRLLDPATEASAKVEAFLSVELYSLLFKEFDGVPLPTDSALEQHMVKMGVAPKQTDKARQAFAKSAEQAGFFAAAGRGRLVLPPSASSVSPGQAEPVERPAAKAPDEPEDILSNALLVALFRKMLPDEGKEFSAHDRRRFFRALAVNLDVIYGEPSDGALDSDEIAKLFRVGPAPVRTGHSKEAGDFAVTA